MVTKCGFLLNLLQRKMILLEHDSDHLRQRLHLFAERTKFLENYAFICHLLHRRADKSLARPGRKQVWKHVRDARDFNNIETRAVIKFFFLQVKAPKEIYAILTETLACFLPGRATDLSAPL